MYFIKENFENDYRNNKIKLELVISRYNEDLEWLKKYPFNKYPSVCYNKGQNEDFYKPKNMKIITIKNVGRCDHTYMYHIVNNYNNLSNYTMFLPGSCNIQWKKEKAVQWIKEMEKHKSSVFVGFKTDNGIKEEFYNFKLDEWTSTDSKNKSLNSENKLKLNEIRPFGKWYENHFGNKKIYYSSLGGVIGVDRDHILTTPREKYIKFMEELNDHSNPEVGHYVERAWAAIFNITDENNLFIMQ